MKKLILIALLMLALVFTVVACQNGSGSTETSGEDTTVADATNPDSEPDATPAESEEDSDPAEDSKTPDESEEDSDPSEVTTNKGTEETTEATPEETTEATPEETTEAVTEDPIDFETDALEGEGAPTIIFGAEALNNATGLTGTESGNPPVMSANGKYVTFTPMSGDYYYNPLPTPFVGDRYVAIKYRTNNAEGTSLQIYIGSGNLDNDNDMLKTEIIGDGEWHIAVFDIMKVNDQLVDAITGQEGDAGSYDGSSVNFFRLDPMDCNYVLNDEGMAYKDNSTWVREPLPDGAYIDIQYVAFFSTAEAAAAWSAPAVKLPDEDTHNFQSDLAGETTDTLADSGLIPTFTLTEALNPFNSVTAGEFYKLGGFCQLIAKTNGIYAFSSNITDMSSDGFSVMFARGVEAFSFGDGGYFGGDGNDATAGSTGCAGIYVIPAVKDGQLKLRISIKTLAEDGVHAVADVTFVDIDSRLITMADDGNTVYIMAGDKLVATVEISGTHDYAYTNVAADAIAGKVVLTVVGEEPREIANAIVAASHISDVGLAVRGGASITFTELNLMPFTSVTIPAMEEKPAISEDDTFYPQLNGTYYVIDETGYAAAYTLTFTIIESGMGTLSIESSINPDVAGTYDWTYTTDGGLVVAGDKSITVAVNRFGMLAFQCIGLMLPQELATEIPEAPVTGDDDGLKLGENAIDTPAGFDGVNLTFTAPESGTYVFSNAEGETNSYPSFIFANGDIESPDLPYEITMEAGESITLNMTTYDLSADVIDIVITLKA